MTHLEVRQAIEYGIFEVVRYHDPAYVVVMRKNDRLYFTLLDHHGEADETARRMQADDQLYDARLPVALFSKAVSEMKAGTHDPQDVEGGEFYLIDNFEDPDRQRVRFLAPCGDEDTTVLLAALKEVVEKFAPVV